MRIAIFLAALLAAGSASAGPTDGERWDMGVVERRGAEVLTTGLTFRRTGPGEWTLRARCQVTDTRTKRWRVRTGQGAAVRSMGLILVDAGAARPPRVQRALGRDLRERPGLRRRPR